MPAATGSMAESPCKYHVRSQATWLAQPWASDHRPYLLPSHSTSAVRQRDNVRPGHSARQAE